MTGAPVSDLYYLRTSLLKAWSSREVRAVKAFIEAWLITFLKRREDRGASREEIISFVDKVLKRGLVLPPVKLEEIERLLSLYEEWGLVERKGERYFIKLETLDETIRDVLEKMTEEELSLRL